MARVYPSDETDDWLIAEFSNISAYKKPPLAIQPDVKKAQGNKSIVDNWLSIEQLVESINQDNLHAESYFGTPVGKEVF